MAYNKLSSPQSLDLAGMIEQLDDSTLRQILSKVSEFCTLLRADITSQEYGATRLSHAIDSITQVDTDVPILSGLDLRASSESLIEWSSGTITYKGTTYNITEGTLDYTYAYWEPGDTTLTGKDAILVADLDPERFWLCQRIGDKVFPTPISPITIAGLAQSGTVYTSHAYAGNLIVGDRTSLTEGTGMFSSGSTGDWSIGDGTNYYVKADATAHTLTIGGAGLIIEGSGGDGIDTYYQSSAPSPVNAGDLWYDTTDYSQYRYNGSSWDKISDITANKTALNTTNVGTVAASRVAGWAYSSDTTKIDGGDIYTGTVTANAIATNFSWSKNFIMDTSGKIYTSGKTYGAGSNGIFIGYDSSAYKFDITNGSYYFRWDGTNPPEINTTTGRFGDASSNYINFTSTTGTLKLTGTSGSYSKYIIAELGEINLFSEYSTDNTYVSHSATGSAYYHSTDGSYTLSERKVIISQSSTGGFIGVYGSTTSDKIFIASHTAADREFTGFNIKDSDLDYQTNAGTSSDTYKTLVHNGSGSNPSWQGRAVTLSGRVVGRTTNGACTVDNLIGSGVTCDRISSGTYNLNLGTGSWIAWSNVTTGDNTGSGQIRLICGTINASGYFDNNNPSGNIRVTSTSDSSNVDFNYFAIRVS